MGGTGLPWTVSLAPSCSPTCCQWKCPSWAAWPKALPGWCIAASGACVCLVCGHAACSPTISLALLSRFGRRAEGAGGLRCLSCDLGDTEAEWSWTLGGNRPKTECAGVAQGFAQGWRWKGEVKGRQRASNSQALCLNTWTFVCTVSQAATASGPRGGYQGWWGGGLIKLPRELKQLLVIPKAGSHQDTTPVLSPQYPWALSVPLAGSGQARCQGLAAPGSGACLFQAGRILYLSLGCTQHWQPAQCPHTTTGS